jgi:hypothetical protein
MPIVYVYPPIFCKHDLSHVEYNYLMIKVDWLVPGVVSSFGLVIDQTC